MKIRPLDRMRDSFYASLIFVIEQEICFTDETAKAKGITLTDSQIQSALVRAKGLCAGKKPKSDGTSERDLLLNELVAKLHRSPKGILEETEDDEGLAIEKPLDAKDWIMSIEATIDSIKVRKSDIPGSRDYLDFLVGFIAHALRMHEEKNQKGTNSES